MQNATVHDRSWDRTTPFSGVQNDSLIPGLAFIAIRSPECKAVRSRVEAYPVMIVAQKEPVFVFATTV